jgi:hypothetical protein
MSGKLFYKNDFGGMNIYVAFVVCMLAGAVIFLGPGIYRNLTMDPSLVWNNEELLVGEDDTVSTPADEQPQFEMPLQFKSALTNDAGMSRGDVSFIVGSEGRLSGSWSGEFKFKQGVDHQIMKGEFYGNIVPSKIYCDENGQEDETCLYYYSKGQYLLLEYDNNTGKVRKFFGTIYVTGWINDQYVAKGEMIITRDKKDFKKYNFEATGREPEFEAGGFLGAF